MNQYDLLERLAEDPHDKATYARKRKIAEDGYASFYSDLMPMGPHALTSLECKFVMEVLDLHQQLQDAPRGL